jgi:anti-sigma factor RsiW
MTDHDDLDEDLALLLAFYANGSLAAAQGARVAAALERSAALRSELAAVRSLQTLVQHGGAHFEVADEAETAARLETLLTRIDAEALPQQIIAKRPAAPAQSGFWASLFSFHWQPALAMAAAALVLVQSGTIGYFVSRDTPTSYGSLSGPDVAAPKAAILLQFKTGARWYDIQALMMQADMHFVSGPADGTVGVAPGKPKTATEIAALIAHLRASPIVSFAGAAE